jgi:hypothetical protein
VTDWADGPCSYAAGAATSAGGAAAAPPCGCSLEYRPVCASKDGAQSFQTHANACLAKCARAAVKTQGECAASSGGGEEGEEQGGAAQGRPQQAPGAPQETPGSGVRGQEGLG